MNPWKSILTILTTLSASLAVAEDLKTIDGKEYKDIAVTRVEPDGIIVKMKSGISKLYFVELPNEVQQRFHYDPQMATAYSAQQAASYEVYQKQQEEVRHRQEEVDMQNRENIAKQQAANDRAQASQDRQLVRGQQDAAQKANRSRRVHPRRYTTVLHSLPAGGSQSSQTSSKPVQSKKSTPKRQ